MAMPSRSLWFTNRRLERGGAHYPISFECAELEAEWFKRTGIYPMHGDDVVKDSVLAEHPWLETIYDANAAKTSGWRRGTAGTPDNASDKKYADCAKIVGHYPLPYGIDSNLATIKGVGGHCLKRALRLVGCHWTSCRQP